MPREINEIRDHYEYLVYHIFQKLLLLETEMEEAWDAIEDMEEGQEKIDLEQKMIEMNNFINVFPNYLADIDSQIYTSVMNEIRILRSRGNALPVNESVVNELFMNYRAAMVDELSVMNNSLINTLTRWGIAYVGTAFEE
jgi:hypothetical protein